MKDNITLEATLGAIKDCYFRMNLLSEKIERNNQSLREAFYQIEDCITENECIQKEIEKIEEILSSKLTSEEIYGE